MQNRKPFYLTTLVISALLGCGMAAADSPTPWTLVKTPTVKDPVVNDVAAVAPGAVFLVGYTRNQLPGVYEFRNLIERWNGTQWEVMLTPDIETAPAVDMLFGVSGTAADDVWAVGTSRKTIGSALSSPTAMHFDGSTWQYVPIPDTGHGGSMSAVFSVARNNVWAVGDSASFEPTPVIFHYNGNIWTSKVLPRPVGCAQFGVTTMTSIVATPSGVYAGGHCQASGGELSFILRGAQGNWTEVATFGPAKYLQAMTVTPQGIIWATGNDQDNGFRGFMMYGRVTTWTKRTLPSFSFLSGVASTPAGIVFVGSHSTSAVASARPKILTKLGTTWQINPLVPPMTSYSWFSKVTSDSNGDTWAVGQAFNAFGSLIITAHP